MTEQRQYDGGAGTAHSAPVQHSGRSETPADSAFTGHTGPEAVAGPFTLREAVIGASVLVMFIGTILPFVDGVNLWRTFSLFFLGIGILLPVTALALLIGRRLGTKGLRVGSLSVDQFASVTAAFAAAFFFLQTVTTFGIGSFIALLGSVGFLAATVGGPHLGVFKPDFAGRPSSSAHRIAREALPAKPRPPKPVPAETVSGWSAQNASRQHEGSNQFQGAQAGPETREAHPAVSSTTAAEPSTVEAPGSQADAGAQADTGVDTPAESDGPAATTAQPTVEKVTDQTVAQQKVQQAESSEEQAFHPRTESISATRDAEDDEPVLEAFWFAVGTPRSVVDEQTGAPLFVLQPGDWEVGIEDRGHEFLVQDKRTGRIGVMRDLRNIERAPREG